MFRNVVHSVTRVPRVGANRPSQWVRVCTAHFSSSGSGNALAKGDDDHRMVNKILIANRGEIACRIIRTAKRLNVKTVAVCSEVDVNAQHVAEADEAYCIGPAPAAESYLVEDKIIEIAKLTNAQAIHPGYGFLSEKASFADKCEKSGIEFIGPPTGAIVSMGSKSESKIIMEAAGVPCTPGYHGEDQSLDRLIEEAKKIGFPVMLKAVLGGGGKGMRVVENEKDLPYNIEACQREAKSSFGDERILIEKFLRKPRHIELQVFADKFGNTIHLFERDCSVQRRHQKVLEESPAPGMPQELREKMGAAAVAAAKAVGYVGAGTVEFMVDASEQMSIDSPFYFMEMNTRLQVEHPVTEMVTGIDLVEWQLRIASGQPLPIQDQNDLKLMGHALEARVYAESPGTGFLPGSGKIQYLSEPANDVQQYIYPMTKFKNDLRIETGVRQGDTVSVFYDPMISKVVVHSPDRDTALRQMERALRNYHVVGLPTNIEFLLQCLQHPAFAKGGVDTSFIGKHKDELLGVPPGQADDHRAASLAVVARSLLHEIAKQQAQKSTFAMPHGFRVVAPYKQVLELELGTDDGSEPRTVNVVATQLRTTDQQQKLAFEVKIDDQHVYLVEANVKQPKHEKGGIVITVNGSPTRVVPVIDTKNSNTMHLFDASNGGAFSRLAYKVTAISKASTGDAQFGAGAALAPMPGKIIKVMVNVDDTVEKDQPLIIMEAMKMEHVIKAAKAGTVTEVSVSVGEFVDDSKVLCKVE